MRIFEDEGGREWTASVVEREDQDYKGRYSLLLLSQGESGEERVSLREVCWNSERAAEKALQLLSETELKRRLRSAVGRAAARDY
jgi:hypothetical protein